MLDLNKMTISETAVSSPSKRRNENAEVEFNAKRMRRRMSRRLSRRHSLLRGTSTSSLVSHAAELGRLSINLDDAEIDKLSLMADLTGDYFDDLAMLYNLSADICVPEACAEAEGIQVLMTRIETRVDDLTALELSGVADAIRQDCQLNIFKGILRIYTHIYQHHYIQMIELSVDTTLNMCFQRFVEFLNTSESVDKTLMQNIQQLVSSIRMHAKHP